MKKLIAIFVVICLCMTFVACGKSETDEDRHVKMTEEILAELLETHLEPQLRVYEELLGVDDLSVKIKFRKFKTQEPYFHSDGEMGFKGWVSCDVDNLLYSPTIAKLLSEGQFTDELLKKLSIVELEYGDMEWGNYKGIHVLPNFVPTYIDDNGEEYFVDDELVTRRDLTIVYIASDAELAVDAKVGDNAYDLLSEVASSASSSSSKEKCAVCNGSGYVKYYYGSSDLQAALDGYDPYTVGECTSCGGTGR